MTAKKIIQSIFFLTCVVFQHYAVAQCRNTESLSGQDILNIIGPQLCENMKTLTISGETVTDLTPIAHVKTIKELRIIGTSLTSLSQLNAVLTDHEQTSDSHYFSRNDLITSLAGLKIEGGSIVIRNMASLSSIDFEMSGDIYGEIEVINNDQLKDLNVFADKQYQNFEIVGNDGLEDLTGFSGISIVDPDGKYRSNNLLIKENHQLKDLTGMQVSTDKMEISNNDQLADLSGADTSYVRRTLLIQENKHLTALNGIAKFKPIDTYVYITIFGNPGLVSLRGLSGMDYLTGVGIRIYENNSLTSLQGFENMRVRSVHISSNEKLRSTAGLKNITTFLPFEISRSKIDDFMDIVEVRSSVEIHDNPDIAAIKNLGNSEDSVSSKTRIEVHNNDNLKLIENLSPKSDISEYWIRDNDALESISINNLRTRFKIRRNKSLTYLNIRSATTLFVEENNLLTTIFLGSASSSALQLSGDAFQELVLSGSIFEIKNPFYNISGEGRLKRLTFTGSFISLPEVSLASIEQLTLDGLLLFRNPISKVKNLDFRSNDLSVLEVIDFENLTINANRLIDLSGLEDMEINKLTLSGSSITKLQGMKNIQTNELAIQSTSLKRIDFKGKDITTGDLDIRDNPDLESIHGINQLVTGDLESDFNIWDNDNLTEIDFGLSDKSVLGQIHIRDNPKYASCCNLVNWVGDQYQLYGNGGICDFRRVFPITDYCDIPVRVYDKRTRKLLNTIAEIDPDKPELVIYEGTEEELIFEVPNVAEDRVIMQGANGYRFKQEEFSETSTAFTFDENWFRELEVPDNFKIILSSESKGEIKSFDVRPIKRPVIFIDMNEDQGRNFKPLMAQAIRNEALSANRIARIVFIEESNHRDRTYNRQTLRNAIKDIRSRTLGTEGMAVDVVAFGKAGLYARQYLRGLRTSVSRYITVNTPHSGSELEDAALSFDDMAVGLFQLLTEEAVIPAIFVSGFSIPYIVVVGTVKLTIEVAKDLLVDEILDEFDEFRVSRSSSLASTSETVNRINRQFPLNGIAKHSIASIYDFKSNDILKDGTVPFDIQFYYRVFDDLVCFDFESIGFEDLAGQRNNTYSSVEAQFGGLGPKFRSQVDGDYGNLDTDEMRQTIIELLDEQDLDRFTTAAYRQRDVPESLVAKCESFINYSEIIKTIRNKLGVGNAQRVLDENLIHIDTLLDNKMSLSYEGELLSLYVFSSDFEFYEAKLGDGTEVSLDVFPDEDSVDPIIYMAYGITPDSTIVEDYYLHAESEVELEDYTLQDFELNGIVGDSLSYQMIAQDSNGGEVDVTALVTDDLWPTDDFTPIYAGRIIANEATTDTLKMIIAEQDVYVFTDIQEETAYLGLVASDSTLVAENATISSTIDSVQIVSNESIDELTFSLDGDTSLFSATFNQEQFFIEVLNSLDFEADSAHQLTLIAINDDTSDTLQVDISVTNVNEAPILTISEFLPIDENDSNLFVGTVLATDPENDTLSYSTSFPTKFQVKNDSIWVISGFDHEADSLVTLDIIATDGEFETSVPGQLTISDVNESPTITVAELVHLNENDSNQYVATLSIIDPEQDSLTYWLSLPTKFEIRNDSLWAIAGYNYETDSLIELDLAVADSVFQDSLSTFITIADVNEAPTDVILDNDSIYVEDMATAWAGTLFSVDEDFNDQFTYTLEDLTDQFEIRNDSLIVGVETQTGLYNLPITTTDKGGLSTTVNVTLKVEREVILGIPKITFVVYPNPANHQLNIRHESGQLPEYWLYDLRGSLLLQGKGTQIDVSQITDQMVLLRTCFGEDCDNVKVVLKR